MVLGLVCFLDDSRIGDILAKLLSGDVAWITFLLINLLLLLKHIGGGFVSYFVN